MLSQAQTPGFGLVVGPQEEVYETDLNIDASGSFLPHFTSSDVSVIGRSELNLREYVLGKLHDIDDKTVFYDVSTKYPDRCKRVVDIAKELRTPASVLVKYNTLELLEKYQKAQTTVDITAIDGVDIDDDDVEESIAVDAREKDFQDRLLASWWRVIFFTQQMRFMRWIHRGVTDPALSWVFMPICHVTHYMFKRNVGIAFMALNLVVLNETALAKMLIASGATGLVSSTLKQLVQAPRPNYIDHDLLVPGYTSAGYSTPSLHASIAAAGSTIFGFYFNSPVGWTISGSILALTMMSRMMLGVHYPQDVTIGALIGIAMALSVQRGFSNDLKVESWEFAAAITAIVTLNTLMIPVLLLMEKGRCIAVPEQWMLYVFKQESNPPNNNRKSFWSAMGTAGGALGLITTFSNPQPLLGDMTNLVDVPLNSVLHATREEFYWGAVISLFLFCYFSSFMIEFMRKGLIHFTGMFWCCHRRRSDQNRVFSLCRTVDSEGITIDKKKNAHKVDPIYHVLEGVFYVIYAWANIVVAAVFINLLV